MLFRSKKSSDAAVAELPRTPEAMFEQIEALSADNRERRDPDVERRIRDLRHQAATELTNPEGERPDEVAPALGSLPAGDPLPDVSPAELTPQLLRAGLLRDGCLLVRGLIDRDEALRTADEIDRAFDAFAASDPADPAKLHGSELDGYYDEFSPNPPFDLRAERGWVTGGMGLWLADSPRVLFDVLDAFDRTGLQRVIAEYLGERPALSVNKCTLRRVRPDIFEDNPGSAWHQDGAFLGDVRAVNVWLSLSRCGDVAPGMDVVPRRLDRIVPTGTEGATFDWSVSQAVAEQAAGGAGIVRPIFEPGDVLLFDELFLHATAADDAMTETRYAVESWFFGPSGFPSEYAPLAF